MRWASTVRARAWVRAAASNWAALFLTPGKRVQALLSRAGPTLSGLEICLDGSSDLAGRRAGAFSEAAGDQSTRAEAS